MMRSRCSNMHGMGLPWIYLDNQADSLRQGGFGQTSGDTANDGSGLLKISEDPDDSSNKGRSNPLYGVLHTENR
jgi:hypothetical protein